MRRHAIVPAIQNLTTRVMKEKERREKQASQSWAQEYSAAQFRRENNNFQFMYGLST